MCMCSTEEPTHKCVAKQKNNPWRSVGSGLLLSSIAQLQSIEKKIKTATQACAQSAHLLRKRE